LDTSHSHYDEEGNLCLDKCFGCHALFNKDQFIEVYDYIQFRCTDCGRVYHHYKKTSKMKYLEKCIEKRPEESGKINHKIWLAAKD